MGQSNYKPVFAAWKKKLAKSPLEIRKGIATDMVEKIVTRTPHVTGLTRANWNAANGAPDNAITDDTDYAGTRTITRAKQAIRQIQKGVKFYFTNSVPWIRKLELGSSTQAPAGFVTITLAELRLFAKRWFKIELG